MKNQVMNKVSVKGSDSNGFVDSIWSIDKLRMLALSSAEKFGSP